MARRLAIVALVLLLLLLILPLGIGMAMGVCPDCTAAGAPTSAMVCAMLVAAVLIFAMLMLNGLVSGVARPPGLVTIRELERPPRSS